MALHIRDMPKIYGKDAKRFLSLKSRAEFAASVAIQKYNEGTSTPQSTGKVTTLRMAKDPDDQSRRKKD